MTFTKDVLTILQRECQGCHRPGQLAPMSFMSFEETRPSAESIKEAVTRGDMPPWNADPEHGTRALLTGFVPGARGDVYAEGMARRIPPGSELLVQMHYNETGRVEHDQSSVGIMFGQSPPKKSIAKI